MESIAPFQLPSSRTSRGAGDPSQPAGDGAAFLALIESFFGSAAEPPPSVPTDPATGDAGFGKSADGVPTLVQPSLFLEATGGAEPTTAELAGGLALQAPPPPPEPLPTDDGQQHAAGSGMAADTDADLPLPEGSDNAAAPAVPPAPSANGADDGQEIADAPTPAPPVPQATPAPQANGKASGVAGPATGGESGTTAGEPATGSLPAERMATAADDGSATAPDEQAGRTPTDAKIAAAPQGDGSGAGNPDRKGRDEGGRSPAGRPEATRSPPDNVLREQARAETNGSGTDPDPRAHPVRESAAGSPPRAAAALQPERPAPVEPTAVPPPHPTAHNPPGEGLGHGVAAAGGLRPAGDPAGSAPLAGSTPAAGHGPTGQPHPASQTVSVTLSRMADGRSDRMTIQLRPAELGTVEVKLDFRSDGTVQAMIVADRAETLNLLQRDAPTLEKALQDAGLRTDSDGLNFSLRDGGEGERNPAGFRQAFGKPRGRGPALADDGTRTMTLVAGSGAKGDPGRVDIRI